MPAEPLVVMAIDPGRCKCGLAVVRAGAVTEVLRRAVVPTDRIRDTLADLQAQYHPDTILLGDGTTATDVAKVADELGLRVELVDEALTSLAARARYFSENPPRGLRRLIPTSMQTPPEPCDDYVAVILAERHLANRELP